jgi:hypothetical protein
MSDTLQRRPDGKYQETLSGAWLAEYAENPDTGLWCVEIYQHDAVEWHSDGHASLEDARDAARQY